MLLKTYWDKVYIFVVVVVVVVCLKKNRLNLLLCTYNRIKNSSCFAQLKVFCIGLKERS